MRSLSTIDRFVSGVSRHKKSTKHLPQSPYSLLIDTRRLRSANILLITFKALANEIAKNLVLAGIGSLTILDHEVVTETDLCAQFFVSEEHVGQNVSRLRLSDVKDRVKS